MIKTPSGRKREISSERNEACAHTDLKVINEKIKKFYHQLKGRDCKTIDHSAC